MRTPRSSHLVGQPWFWFGLALRLVALCLLAHVYDVVVFQDAGWRLAGGEGIYALFAAWLSAYGDGYYAYPPAYAYMLWLSGRVAAWLGGAWWVHQVLIKAWMALADLALFAFLRRIAPAAARAYWTLWFIPIVGIAQVQPDLWVGLAVLGAYYLARREQWTAAGVLLAVGAALKLTPVVLVPFVVLYLAQRRLWAMAGRATAAFVLGFLALWAPYAAFYDDSARFAEVLAFHLERPAFGLHMVTALRSMTDSVTVLYAMLGDDRQSIMVALTTSQWIDAAYPFATLLAFGWLGAQAYASRWSLEQVFALPLLMFLLVNKVVNEQHFLHVLPLLLLAGPASLRWLTWPYAVYVLAAGTPLRFFPPQYGFPLAPEQLLPEAWRASAMLPIGFVLSTAVSVSALGFSYGILRRILESAPRRAGALVGETKHIEAARTI